MKKFRTFLTGAFMLIGGGAVPFLPGCSFSTYYLQTGAKAYAPIDAGSVKIYAGDPTSGHYEVIGSLAVNALGEEKAERAIREKAASLGANAVIRARLVKFTSYGGRTGISGVAVRIL